MLILQNVVFKNEGASACVRFHVDAKRVFTQFHINTLSHKCQFYGTTHLCP